METKEKEVYKLVLKPIGSDGNMEIRQQLDDFVKENFELLYKGAVRLKRNLKDKYGKPRAIHLYESFTYICIENGLKTANGHSKGDIKSPTKEQLIKTIEDIQKLIDAAAENIHSPFILKIIDNRSGEEK